MTRGIGQRMERGIGREAEEVKFILRIPYNELFGRVMHCPPL